MGEALKHHYEVNSHHPEHFDNGINDMTIIDVIEMLCDWCAATDRHEDGDIIQSIKHNTGRFELGDVLSNILLNTVRSYGIGKNVDK